MPLGPGPWTWRWGGWTVLGEGGRILRLAHGDRDVAGEIPWPDAPGGLVALPGRIDGAASLGENDGGPTLLLPPGGEAAALITGGEPALLSCQERDPAAGASPSGPVASALPMHAHRPLRTALEAADGGLSFRAPGIDAGPALFWASAATASPARSDAVTWEHVMANLALGGEAPGPDALEELLRLDPVRGVRAVGAVGEWRDSAGLLAALKGPLLRTAESLAAGADGPAPERRTVSALLAAAAALEGAGLRRGATAIRDSVGSASPPHPIVGRPEAMEGIRAGVDTFAAAPTEAVCDDAPNRKMLLRLPAEILFGFLGASGDAPFGRLRLAPTMAPGIEAFEARGVRLGPARVRVRYRLDQAGHTFTVEQSDGPVPLNLVLDLGLPDTPSQTWIDGEAAEVDLLPSNNGCRARVQLPLDRPREIRIGGVG